MVFQGTITFVLHSIFLYFAFLFVVVAANHATETEGLDGKGALYATLAAVMAVMLDVFMSSERPMGYKKCTGHFLNQQQHKRVWQIMADLGEIFMWHTYQMTKLSFWALYHLLLPLVPDST